MSANQKIIASITEALNKFFSEKGDEYTKKELENIMSVAVKDAYDNSKVKGKAPRKLLSAKEKKENKEENKDEKEEKPKKELTAYQKFMKEKMAELKAEEDAKEDGVEKIKPKDLMKKIGELWKQQKE